MTSHINDDEIDLFQLIQNLWDGKGVIAASIAVCLVAAIGYVVIKEPEYESYIHINTSFNPPVEGRKSIIQVMDAFYDEALFKEWKSANRGSAVVAEDFSRTTLMNGFVVAKREDELTVRFSDSKTNTVSLLVKSNELRLLDSYFSYLGFLNDKVTEKASGSAESLLRYFTAKSDSLSQAQVDLVTTELQLVKFLNEVSGGMKLLSVERPTMPEKQAPRTGLILILSVMIGGIIGALYVLVQNAWRQRQRQEGASS
mgnify:CR=1 FL=1